VEQQKPLYRTHFHVKQAASAIVNYIKLSVLIYKK